MVNKAKQKAAQHLAVMAYKCLQENPEAGLPKLLKLFDVLDTKDSYKSGRDFIRTILRDPSNTWYRYLLAIWEDVDSEVRFTFFQTFFSTPAQRKGGSTAFKGGTLVQPSLGDTGGPNDKLQPSLHRVLGGRL